MNSKKGISGVVSTVLIILIVVAAVAILGAIVINSANKTSSKIEDSTLCQDLVIGPVKLHEARPRGILRQNRTA